MAESVLKALDSRLEVYSAGTNPAPSVHPNAVRVMREIGVEIGDARPKSVDLFLAQSFDYVVTVCDNAREICPVFTGKVAHRIHMGFRDPAHATGTEEEILREFRLVRDEIKERFSRLLSGELSHE
jgi:arsenate reductase